MNDIETWAEPQDMPAWPKGVKPTRRIDILRKRRRDESAEEFQKTLVRLETEWCEQLGLKSSSDEK
jgi:hypothetical protein